LRPGATFGRLAEGWKVNTRSPNEASAARDQVSGKARCSCGTEEGGPSCHLPDVLAVGVSVSLPVTGDGDIN